MDAFAILGKKGEGTFSEVVKAQTKKGGVMVALKRFRKQFKSLEEVHALREIQALKRLNPHPHIIDLLDVIYDEPKQCLVLAFELMELNLYELISRRQVPFAESKCKAYMYQICKALEYIHRNGIFHRDLKPENILVKDDILKLADFGSCRGIYSKQPYTEYIATRWYRSPECLLSDGFYTYKLDMWGAGCVYFEMLSMFPLFPGSNELDQIAKIHNIMGTPSPKLLMKLAKNHPLRKQFNFPQKEGTGIMKLIPGVSHESIELMNRLLAYDPEERMTASQSLRHPCFKELRGAEKLARKSSISSAIPPVNGAARRESKVEGSTKQDVPKKTKGGEVGQDGDESSANDKVPLISPKFVANNNAASDRAALTAGDVAAAASWVAHAGGGNAVTSSAGGGTGVVSNTTTVLPALAPTHNHLHAHPQGHHISGHPNNNASIPPSNNISLTGHAVHPAHQDHDTIASATNDSMQASNGNAITSHHPLNLAASVNANSNMSHNANANASAAAAAAAALNLNQEISQTSVLPPLASAIIASTTSTVVGGNTIAISNNGGNSSSSSSNNNHMHSNSNNNNGNNHGNSHGINGISNMAHPPHPALSGHANALPAGTTKAPSTITGIPVHAMPSMMVGNGNPNGNSSSIANNANRLPAVHDAVAVAGNISAFGEAKDRLAGNRLQLDEDTSGTKAAKSTKTVPKLASVNISGGIVVSNTSNNNSSSTNNGNNNSNIGANNNTNNFVSNPSMAQSNAKLPGIAGVHDAPEGLSNALGDSMDRLERKLNGDFKGVKGQAANYHRKSKTIEKGAHGGHGSTQELSNGDN